MDSEYIITALKYIDERAEHLIEATDDYQSIIGLGGIKYALESLINEIKEDEEGDVNVYKFTDYKE